MEMTYGRLSDLVEEAEVVLPDGREAKLTSEVLGLFFGSLGTTGIITKIRMRTILAPREKLGIISSSKELESIHKVVLHSIQKGLRPTAMTVLDLREVDKLPSEERLQAGRLLLFSRFDGFTRTDVRSRTRELTKLCLAENMSVETLEAKEVSEVEREITDMNRKICRSINSLYMCVLGLREEVLPLILDKAREVSRNSGAYSIYSYGPRKLRFHVPFDPSSEEDVEAASEHMRSFIEFALKAGARFLGARTGKFDVKWIGLRWKEGETEVLRRLKEALDPRGIMNPGKVPR
jgi:FAD/FMN-containing dehydrogenase